MARARDRHRYSSTPSTPRNHSPTPRRPSNPRWIVYLLRCSDGSLCTGITNDLPKRLKAHAVGKVCQYTRGRPSVMLADTEPQRFKPAAPKREAAIERLRRAEKKRLLAEK